MKIWGRGRSVRAGLTMWYVGVMVVILAIYALAVFVFVSRAVSNALDDRLRTDLRWATEMIEQTPDGKFIWFEGDDGTTEQDSPWLQVWSLDGELLVQSAFAEDYPLNGTKDLIALQGPRIVSIPLYTATFRLLSDRSKVAGQPVVVQVAVSEASMARFRRDLVLMLILGLPIGVALAGLGGYSLARRALAPVDRMAERARYITAERLSERLPIDNPDYELGRLALVFNDTLGRLESSFDQMRRFTSDISHELRTPLTAIRSVGEIGLRTGRSERVFRGIIGSMLEEADRLACLVDRLLSLSRAESGQAKLSLEDVDIHDLAHEVVGHLSVLAEEKRQTITIDDRDAPTAIVDRLVLRQALINLVDNAIKYTPAGGRIAVHVAGSATTAFIDVSDTGPGVGPDGPRRIFDRYYRDREQEDGQVKGSGLGLAIAKWAVEVNGGKLTLEASSAAGSTFRIALPAGATRARHAAIA